MFHERFVKGESLIHSLDPRVKLIVAFLYAIMVALSSKISSLILASFFTAFLFVLSRLQICQVLKRILTVNYFIVLLVVVMPFTFPGRVLYSLGPLAMSKEGLIYGFTLFWKSNLILTTMLLLLSTAGIFNLAHALHHLHVPEKLVQLIFFSFRYIHVLQREYQKLGAAIKLRGFSPQTNLYTYKTYAYLIASLLIKSYDRSERVYKAMRCRGFQGMFPTYKHFQMSPRDKVFALISGIFLSLLGFYTFRPF